MKVKFKKLSDKAKVPVRAHHDDGGMDLFASETVSILNGETKKIKTDISTEFSSGYVMKFEEKSSLGSKGISVMGGLIDPQYRGELLVCLYNHSGKTYVVHKGDKITQAVMYPVLYPEIEEADALEESQRGEGGFGSTGTK